MIESFADIDWALWQPTEQATLMFVLDDNRILLIRKKRGLGAGKVNGPGGRREPNESLLQCAVRETQEELGVVAIEPTLRGRHRFQFTDGYALEVFVYCTDQYSGTAYETDEAIPLWTPIDDIPYKQMWEDDAIWLPMMLNGECFDGCYLFADDRLVDYQLSKLAHTRDLTT